MNSEFGEKLQNAISSEKNLTWRDKNGESIKLIDATDDNLKQWYQHCNQMLFNTNIWSPGKYLIRENIHKTWLMCNTELFVRYLIHECETPIKTKKDLLDFISGHRNESGDDILSESISILFNKLDPIYNKITINLLLDACFDKLDVLNRKMITDKFILSQGIWLTNDEKLELTETGVNGKLRNRMEIIKERLCLNSDIRLRISPTGLTFSEFRSLVQLSPQPKISSLSTIALKTLRDKILLLLDNDLNYHIDKWTSLKTGIEKVAESRGLNING